MAMEKVDLCRRLRHAGLPAGHPPSTSTETNPSNPCNPWQIYWVLHAAVVHYGGQSTRQMPAEMFLRLYESKLLYFRKRHGRLAAQLYKLILLAAALARLLLIGALVAGALALGGPRQKNPSIQTTWHVVLDTRPAMFLEHTTAAGIPSGQGTRLDAGLSALERLLQMEMI